MLINPNFNLSYTYTHEVFVLINPNFKPSYAYTHEVLTLADTRVVCKVCTYIETAKIDARAFKKSLRHFYFSPWEWVEKPAE